MPVKYGIEDAKKAETHLANGDLRLAASRMSLAIINLSLAVRDTGDREFDSLFKKIRDVASDAQIATQNLPKV